MDRNACRRKRYAEMPFTEKDALFRHWLEAYATKKMNLPNMAWSSAAPTGISMTGLGHVKTGICFPEPKFEAQCQQKQAEIDNSYYNA